MNYDSPFMRLPGISPQEFAYLQSATAGLNEQQLQSFLMIYSEKRKSEDNMLIFCVLGLLCIVPGIQRFYTNQIGMGVLFFFTGGLCWVGSIVDLVNYKNLAFDYNQKMVFESLQLIKMSGF